MQQSFGLGQFYQTLPDANAAILIVEPHGIFALSGDNEFQGSVWLTVNQAPVATLLGTAAIKVYDEDEVEITSLAQSGLSANVNGVFKLAPIVATDLAAFQHYRVRIQITYNSQLQTGFRGFTIGE